MNAPTRKACYLLLESFKDPKFLPLISNSLTQVNVNNTIKNQVKET